MSWDSIHRSPSTPLASPRRCSCCAGGRHKGNQPQASTANGWTWGDEARHFGSKLFRYVCTGESHWSHVVLLYGVTAGITLLAVAMLYVRDQKPKEVAV